MKIKEKLILIIAIVIAIILSNITTIYATSSENPEESQNTENYIYLSDIPYIEEKSYAASEHVIRLDKNDSNGLIKLNIEDKETPFIKGICAWATSEIIYDLQNYDFDYFTSYLGVDISEQSTYYNTGVRFYIYTSSDGENWGEAVAQTEYLDGRSNAQFIKVDIKDANYLKLVADDNSNNWWSAWYDEAIYADAKLIKEGYVEDTSKVDFIKTVEEYDELITTTYANQEITGEYELTLLQREFVNNIGYDVLQAFVRCEPEYREIVSWLMNNVENLRLYIIGGTPDGSYIESLKVLSKLYNTYSEDLSNENLTENGTVLKDLYRRMMITLSLTHSTDVGLWASARTGNPDDPNESNAIGRYAIYKDLHEKKLLENKLFESLNIEEMRFVMNNIIDDEEIVWLNAYSTEKGSRNPYSYITYTFDYNYSEAQYYDPENYDTWDEKYNLSEYNITYKEGYPKLWIVFEEGSVCGGLSKTGSNLHGVYGVPSSVVGQPGHAAYIYYTLNENGDAVWQLYNDVSGWAQSSRTEKLSIRMPNGWGIGSYASQYPVTYILLAQANLNDFENYEKSEEILLLANTYSNDTQKLNEIYRKAIQVQPLNFDAWYGLVNLYVTDETKTDKDYCDLAQEIVDALKYYPLPMYDLLRIIEPSITSTEYTVQFTLLQTSALTAASEVTAEETLQQTAVKAVANYLLGNIDSEIATFSFDGEIVEGGEEGTDGEERKNVGAIVLSERFDNVGVVWEYSLDGRETWKQTEEHILKLTDEELSSINEENNILIHIVGTEYNDANIYAIDITKAAVPSNIYNNDYENKVIGATNQMEWSYIASDTWTLFGNELPDLTGDKSILVRMGNTGTTLYSDSTTLNFTADNESEMYKYIPISRLSHEDVSSEETGKNNNAVYAIDGNINTHWHTAWDGSDNEKYITIKLDEPVYISALEYVPRNDANNGKVKNAQILVSTDGETWNEIVSSTTWSTDGSPKRVEFSESVLAQYVKVVGKETVGNYMSASMINLFEDITKKKTPTAEIEYSIKELTNQDVLVKLINPSIEITITNNDGKDTYLFKQNGVFTFEFVDKYGNIGSTTASVDWIDKEAPVASIEYSTTEETTGNVTAKLVSNEEIIIVNNDGNDIFTFTENGDFEFVYRDMAGNIGKTTATVNWIVAEDNKGNDSAEENNKDEENNNEDDSKPGKDEGNNNEGDSEIGKDEESNEEADKEDNIDIEKNLGDIDGNGKISVTDLSQLKLHIIKINTLNDSQVKMADLNNDGKISTTDLSQLKLMIIGLIEK